MKKRIICLIIMLVTVFSVCAEASVLGSKQLFGYTYEIGDGLFLYKNRFFSDQSGVGNQTENYFEYSPNAKTRPLVTLGKYVYGGEDINECYEYLSQSGVRTLGGVNGDFFSVQTGVPSGHVVIDKKIISTDERVLPALGIKEDGSVFTDDFQIVTKMYHNGEETVIPFINKYLQKWGYYMYDSNYYTEITPSAMGKYVTLKIVGGEMKLGGVLKTELVSIEDSISEKNIPEDCIVIALTYEANPELAAVFESFLIGDTVEFTFHSNNDELWGQAVHILASEAGQIVKNGEYCGEDLAGASPRTAVGITAEGKMILYTVDGRQTGHSYGVRIPTLANRMKELGCVDVLNLDGGGSTTISASWGGSGSFDLQNRPSDGALRNDSTYIFFENVTPYSGEASKLFLYPETVYAKSGAKVNYTVKASDDGYFPVEIPGGIIFSAEGNSYVENNEIYAWGEETAIITARAGELSATAKLRSIETPDYIRVFDSNGIEVTEINIDSGETVELNIVAYYNGMEIVSEDSLYGWTFTEATGTVTNEGLFTMGEDSGKIIITAGELTHEIPVNGDAFTDISKNWARHYINDLYDKGVVNGFYNEDGSFEFKPGNYVTKSEMAAMLSRALKFDVNAFANVELPFADLAEIPDWALPHVKALYGSEILKGSLAEDGKIYFYPDTEVNRAEIFTIAGRILEVGEANPCPFDDRDEIPNWAVSYIDALYEKGMINGYADNQLKVWDSITRAEISKIIVKALFN